LYAVDDVSLRDLRDADRGIDVTVPSKVIPLDPKHPQEIPAGAQTYMRLRPTTRMVSVELTYRDGSVSEIKTFRCRAGRMYDAFGGVCGSCYFDGQECPRAGIGCRWLANLLWFSVVVGLPEMRG
jgi:hypothetical protein